MNRVECYSGATHPETPRRVIWQGTIYQVDCVIDRQRRPDCLVFLVKCSPNETLFELTYTIKTESWQIHAKGNLPV